MSVSFTPEENESLAPVLRARNRVVLVTGAAGNIGSYFAQKSHLRYDLQLMVREQDTSDNVDPLHAFGKVITGDITDLERMKELCRGVDTVLHLAGDPKPSAVWGDLLQANIIGTYNTFLAAKANDCRRVIYASSIHAVSGYRSDVQVKTTEPVNPGDLYGVSKCFGEALARYMAEKENISAIVLRIGAFQPLEAARSESGLSMLDAWVSRRDLNQLIEKSIDVENLRFAIFHGLSDNRFKRMDISDARMLVGYAPVDDSTAQHPQLKDLNLRETVLSHSHADGKQESGIREELKASI